jgi:hypothetical protein
MALLHKSRVTIHPEVTLDITEQQRRKTNAVDRWCSENNNYS